MNNDDVVFPAPTEMTVQGFVIYRDNGTGSDDDFFDDDNFFDDDYEYDEECIPEPQESEYFRVLNIVYEYRNRKRLGNPTNFEKLIYSINNKDAKKIRFI